MFKTYLTTLCCTIALTACAVPVKAPEESAQTLRSIVSENYPENVFIGGTIQYRQLDTPAGDILNREFRYITPANIYKQSHIHPTPNKWRWKNPDHWLEIAEQNQQLVRIHGPISPQSSRWVKNDQRTPEQLELMLTEYMTALCKRYNNKSVVKWLDVVNETITEEGTWFGPKPGDKEWENPWPLMGFETDIPEQFPLLQKLGVPKYIIQAFEIANQHAPDLKLILNQHRLTTPESIALLKELVSYIRHRGLRVDGIGWQAHLREEHVEFNDMNGQRILTLDSLVKWAHSQNLEFHITENNIHVKNSVTVDQDKVAKTFANLVQVLLNNQASGVVGWSLWTLADAPHFRDKDVTTLGPWDKDFQPKKAYFEIQKVLQQGNK